MIVRSTARVLALDPHGRVLLFKCLEDDAASSRYFWVLPGGGVEPGEAPERAAVRELREETGIEAASTPGACVLEHETVGRHPDFGAQEIVYHDRHFALHLTYEEVAQLDGEAVERAGYIGHRWWSTDELEATADTVWPEGLAVIVRTLRAGAAAARQTRR